MDAALQGLLFSLLGAAAAYAYFRLMAYLRGRPDFHEIEQVFQTFATAATANHKLTTNEQRLAWVVELGTKYLKAKGLLDMFDPVALAEAGHKAEQNAVPPYIRNVQNPE